MTLDQLKYFCATVEHGSVSEAAKQLNYSQPSLSIAIKKLEEELCVPLFTHGNRKLRLTKEGHFLFKRAKNILEQVDMVRNQMEEFNKLRNSIRFGISSMQSPFILPYLLHDFAKKYPDIRIEVHEDSTKILREKLLQNKLDLAILVIDEKLSNKLRFKELIKTNYSLYTNKNHPFASKKIVTFEELRDEPLVFYEGASYILDELSCELEKRGIEPKILFRTSQVQTIKHSILNNIASAMLLDTSITKKDGLKKITLEKSFPLTFGLCWNKDTYLHNATLKTIDFISNYDLAGCFK